MNPQTVRLRALIDQHRAELRDRVLRATATLTPSARRNCDETIEYYFRILLDRAVNGEDLSWSLDDGFAREFLLPAGILSWAEMECDRIERG